MTQKATSLKNTNKCPRLAIPMGDPCGIGMEVILKALKDPLVTQHCQVTVIGSESLLKQAFKELPDPSILANPDDLTILDIPLENVTLKNIHTGQGNAASGEASFIYLQEAISRTLIGEFQGIVTAPIAKSFWQEAGYDYPGQTEVLAQRAGIKEYGMLFVGRSPYTGWTMRTLLATTHIPLAQVSQTLTPELMSLKLHILIESLAEDFGIKNPKIMISGLNPHSGENGKLGLEEKEWLEPWLIEAQARYPHVKLKGLISPDTLWVTPGQAWYGHQELSALNLGDAYLALYHDQGLIPVKLMAFDQAINTTIGLPFIRTSPDHGTAFDIAGKGMANPNSMKASIQLATELVMKKMINITL
jgi:4-hydroxythreonine-4-phosphate dehydrogenase